MNDTKKQIGRICGISAEELYNGSFSTGTLTLPKSINYFKMIYIEWNCDDEVEKITQVICRNLDTGNYCLDPDSGTGTYMICYGYGSYKQFTNFRFSADGLSMEVTSNDRGNITKIYSIK